jgi:hypothetical protein
MRILVDQAHGNISIAPTVYDYASFVASLASAGYTVDALTSPLTPEALRRHGLFVIPTLGTPQQFYTDAETAALQAYVRQGNGLFLICDYQTNVPGRRSNAAERELCAAFGVILDGNMAIDPTDATEGSGFWIKFHPRGFADHPIMQGINSVQCFATATMSGQGVSLVTTDSDAVPANKSVAMALHYAAGKVVVVGDSNFFGQDGQSFIDYEDNRRFGLNIVDWLSPCRSLYLPLVLHNRQ